MTPPRTHRVTAWLERQPAGVFAAYAAIAAFTTYFCMYSYRKPFAAARYADLMVGPIDLTVDGADEVDPRLNLIKGRGGALFREKLVAAASNWSAM